MSQSIEKYKDQWGGKIANGEEMWWSGVWPELVNGGRRGRLRFAMDPRHNVLLSFFRRVLPKAGPAPKVVDFGCGAGGGTLNFSLYLGLPIEGFDVFPTQLELARQQNARAGGRCTFTKLNDDGSFPLANASVDILFSSDVLGHVPDINVTLRDWARVVKAGGSVVLFTEASYSEADRSVMAQLYRHGIDMIGSVPEHISLWPREKLEAAFEAVGFRLLDRYSASVFHFPLSPKEYLTAIRDNPGKAPRWIGACARVLSLLNKLTPFYPKPQQVLRNALIRAWGRKAYGCNYFYLLERR